MSNLIRISMSLEKDLLHKLEQMISNSRYANRSEYIRDLIRSRLVNNEWEENREALGTITLVYNHHQRKLNEKLIDIQHDHHKLVLVSTHVHLDRHHCAEIVVVKGKARDINALKDRLQRQKGILHATLSMSSTAKKLA